MIGGLIFGFMAGAVVCYLFMRNNPSIEEKVDDIVDNIDENLN